jgi:Holliday junction resolvasome RuvABC ATP-dependent DNA helicase subunit
MVGAIATSDHRLPEASPIANLLQKVQETQIIFVDENNQFCSTTKLLIPNFRRS